MPMTTPPPEQATTAAKLRQFVDRIDRLEDEKAGLQSDIKEVYAEAKEEGFDIKALRKVIRLHRKSRKEREAEQAIIESYLEVLEGMGEAARAAQQHVTGTGALHNPSAHLLETP